MPRTKRFRPRFSVRTLVVVVTLVCLYFGCWEATKRWGVEDVSERADRETSDPFGVMSVAIAPLLVETEALRTTESPKFYTERWYYFWCFGYVVKLPYERQIPDI